MGQLLRSMLPGPNTPQTTSSIVDGTLPPIEMRPSLITGDPTHRDPAVQQAAFQQQAVKATATGRGDDQASRGYSGQPEVTEENGVRTMSLTLPGTMGDRLAQASMQMPPQMALMQKMAAAPTRSDGQTDGLQSAIADWQRQLAARQQRRCRSQVVRTFRRRQRYLPVPRRR